MAVVQISRIQHRRGLQQDLPQLASAELGWSLDTQRLYIGNGTTNEGAPIEGVTEILTQNSISRNELIGYYGTYTFVGNVAGFTAQTGSSTLNPTYRSIQQKLDDFVNVRDFGAKGDGVTDDSSAINRALQEIYKTVYNEVQPLTRRSIYFPGGKYSVSDTILIPPFARLVGDGPSSSIINLTVSNRTVANLVDSKFQSTGTIGTNSAILPQDIEVSGLCFTTSNATPQLQLVNVESASNVVFYNTSFIGNSGPPSYANLVSINGTTNSSRIVFDTCKFIGGGNGLVISNPATHSIRVQNGTFDQIANVAVHLGGSLVFSSLNNFYGNVGSFITRDGNNRNYSLGDYFANTFNDSGLTLGNLQLSDTRNYILSASPVIITLLSNTSVKLNYEISNSSARRYGTLSYISNGVDTVFNDEYIETGTTISANLFANVDSLLASVSSSTASLQINFERFY